MKLQHEVVIPTSYAPDALVRLIDRIRPLYLWYSPYDTDEKIRDRLTKSPETHVDLLSDGDHLAAFAVSASLRLATGELCLFRHGTLIGDGYRSHRLYKKLLRIGLDRHNPDWHATRTQNPRVYETWLQCHGDALMPSLTRQPTLREKSIACTLRKKDIPTDDPFIFRNAYHYDRSQADYHTCRSAEVRQLFQQSLGINDAFLLLARVNT